MNTDTLPVAVIGGGPVGLAAAAHLLNRGETPVVFEAGETVGASIRRWGHVRLFSPWRYVVDGVSAAMLEAEGWERPPGEEWPIGDDLVDRYLLPLAQLPEMAATLRLGARVLSVTRQGFDKLKSEGRDGAPFVLHITHGDGTEEQVLAKAVIDASGTYAAPNPLGASGLPAAGETTAGAQIAYGIPDVLRADRARFAGKRVLVVGSGHSAFNVLGDLAQLSSEEPGTDVTWAIRGTDDGQLYGGGEADALPARGALGTRTAQLVANGQVQLERGFQITAVHAQRDDVTVTAADGRTLVVDEVIAATGFRPDLSLTGELRLALDPVVEAPLALAPLIDPNLHSCGTVPPHGFAELSHPEANFYTVGMKSYGRAPTFLLLTGYEQVRSVVAALTGDLESARNVMLELPETGVCSGPAGSEAASCCGDAPASAPAFVDLLAIGEPLILSVAGGCCGGPAPATVDACCAQDAEAKAAGGAGCGCGEVHGEAVSTLAATGAQ